MHPIIVIKRDVVIDVKPINEELKISIYGFIENE
jgi:hypothetical protein